MGQYIRKTARVGGKKLEATGKTEAEAMKKLAAKIVAAERGELPVSGDMKVDDWYKKWKATYMNTKEWGAQTLLSYDRYYAKYIKPAIGTMKMKAVKAIHLQSILNAEAGRSRSLLQKLLRVMRRMFGRAYKNRIIPFDPSSDLEFPAYTEGSHRSLTDEERALLLKVCETNKHALYIKTLLYTGIRPSEAAALTWKDIDFPHNVIHITAALESAGTEIKAPKTPAGVRDIPIHAALLPDLKEAAGAPFSPVFTTRDGNRLYSGAQQRIWNSVRKDMNRLMGAPMKNGKAQVDLVAPDLTPYCLRHTFATDCAKAGVPINTTRWLLGHSDIAVTARIYQHVNAEALHNGMHILEQHTTTA